MGGRDEEEIEDGGERKDVEVVGEVGEVGDERWLARLPLQRTGGNLKVQTSYLGKGKSRTRVRRNNSTPINCHCLGR